MSKDLNNNERYLRELTDKYEPVPPPLVWNEIEQILDQNKGKRRPFPILWIFGILLLGAILFINLNEKQGKEIATAEQEIIAIDNLKESDSKSYNRKTKNADTYTSFEQARSVNNSEIFNPLEKEHSTNNSETASLILDKQVGKKVEPKKLKSFVSQEQPSNLLNTSTTDKSLESKTNTKTNTNTTNSNQRVIIAKEGIWGPVIMNPLTEITSEERYNIKVAAIQKINWMQISLETEIPKLDPSENFIDISSLESKDYALLASPWFVELGGGLGSNLSKPVLKTLTQEGFRENTESKWYSWSTSFQLGYQFDNLWYTSIGFDLNQTKNKFDFWRRDITSLSVNANQSLQISKSDFFSIGEIRYTFADIGLSIGKRVNINKWHFSLEGGPIFNLIFNANGKVQVGVLEFSRLEYEEDYFNTRIGIGGRLATMLDYPISDKIWISFGPIYHQYFNTVSSDNNPLEERNAILQLKARLKYNF